MTKVNFKTNPVGIELLLLFGLKRCEDIIKDF